MTRRAAAVFPRVTSSAPLRPLSHVTFSQHNRKHSSGRIPVSARTVAIEASGSGFFCANDSLEAAFTGKNPYLGRRIECAPLHGEVENSPQHAQ
jgi:hypothetical protein